MIRPHLDDKPYEPGDFRSAKAVAVSNLVAKLELAPVGQDTPSAGGNQKTGEDACGEGARLLKAPEDKATVPAETPAATGADPSNPRVAGCRQCGLRDLQVGWLI